MGLLQFPKALLKKKLAKMSILATVGGMISRRVFIQKRDRWEKISPDHLESVLDAITAYDMARGAGKLIHGWLRFQQPKLTLEQTEAPLKQMLANMDQTDDSPYERARNRMLVSKVVFYAEGFQWKSCRYERYQQEALTLLKQVPLWKSMNREQVFQAQPFTPEEIIGTTHRMLLMLGGEQLEDYIAGFLKKNRLQTDLDYMTSLLALTLNMPESKQFEKIMLQWLKDYRSFKLNQVNQQEKWVDMSLSAISGEAPAKLGFGLLNRILKREP